ncbi:COMM domain-containing protein 1 isoform X3 [Rissa tridactyla]|uniref:COMM domain-containing protein 1 isoform X3 n=1 Tax=Rissa tridactyla TaxID=75485 RepID=UPI0023BAD978|nr:COMM domain-containing protein 1 isoform X3 [Rissa tridactyla]
MAAPEPPPPPPGDGSKPLSGLLSGIAQAAYHGKAGITEELLRGQLYPEAAPEEFRALRAKMGGLLQSIASADMDLNQLEAFLTAQTKKQGGITADQAAVIAKFWKNHRTKIHESLINQSRWDNVLKNMNWRVDLKSQSRHIDQINTPVAIVEMELGKNGQLCSTAEGREPSKVKAARDHVKAQRLSWGRSRFARNRSFSVWNSMRPR